MELDVRVLLALVGAGMSGASGVFAYWFDPKAFNAVLVALFTAIACGLCVLGLSLGGWLGLSAAIGSVTVLAYRLGSNFGKNKAQAQNKRRGGLFVAILWLWFCAGVAIGYWAGGPWGLLTVTLPTILLFWGGLMALAQFLLPLPRGQERFRQSFRSLVSFSLGTNYPYYVLEGDGQSERVDGNRFGQFFAGPGIVLCDPAHAAVVWEGNRFKQVAGPGVSFTGRFDMLYEAVDLRPQLHTLAIEGITLDGIRIRTEVSIAFRFESVVREPPIPGSFPVDPDRVYTAVWNQPIEGNKKCTCDQIVPMVTVQELRKILSRTTCDQLCARPGLPDPRADIRRELVSRVRAELAGCGLEVMGGWIGNLEPADDAVIARRVGAWRATWQSKVMAILGEGQAGAIQEMESAYVEAHVGLLRTVGELLDSLSGVDEAAITRMAALRFVEALDEMAADPSVRQKLPEDTSVTLGYLHHLLR